jgi:hypothetical protein
VPRGVDPYEKFEAELEGVANMPTPQFSSGSSLGQLESAIGAMNTAQMPTATWPRGMAGGGKVYPGEVVKVGELGAEYIHNRGDNIVEVIPNPRGRIAGRAQAGGTYSFEKSPYSGYTAPGYEWLRGANRIKPGSETTFPPPPVGYPFPGKPSVYPSLTDLLDDYPSSPDVSIPQVLGPVYNYLGFKDAPQFRAPGNPMARMKPSASMSADDWRRLGIKPRLVRDVATGKVYHVDPQGVPRLIPSNELFREWGFDMADVVNMTAADMQGMYGAAGSAWAEAPPILEGTSSAYPQQAVPLRLPSELGGYALPDPRTIANLYRTFDPANRKMLLDALDLSEMSGAQAGSLIEAFTPSGTAGRVGFG